MWVPVWVRNVQLEQHWREALQRVGPSGAEFQAEATRARPKGGPGPADTTTVMA